MLFDARCNRKDIGIEDNVGGVEADGVDKDVIGTAADLDLARYRIRLALLIERHDDCRGTKASNQTCLFEESFFTLFHTDAVDDALSVNAFETRGNHLPVGAVDHNGHTNIFVVQQPQESFHATRTVKESFVHVDIDHIGPAIHLILSNTDRFVVLFFAN